MKLPALILTVLLGTLALAQAQIPSPDVQVPPSPTPKGSKAGAAKEPAATLDGGVSFIQDVPSPAAKNSKAAPGKDPNMNPDGSVSLAPGPLENVVREIEKRISYWARKESGERWSMPNVLYGPGAPDAVVPGALTLRGVSPLQAVTLAAAAAGCTIDPISSIREESDPEDKAPTIIGYRIALEQKPKWSKGGNFYGQATQQLLPSPEVKLDEPVRGVAGDVTVGNRANKGYSNAPGNPSPNRRPLDDFLVTAQKESNRSFVRVYALGSILNGSKEEVALKERNFDQLVSSAMEKSVTEAGAAGVSGASGGSIGVSSSGKAMPELSFHLELKALIVKGTAEQHEIIEQVLKALKENETKPTVPVGQ